MQLRDLPSTDALTRMLVGESDLPRPVVVDVARMALDEARGRLTRGDHADPVASARERLHEIGAARPTEVVNATGVLLHTNLGRAVPPVAALEAEARVAGGASNVELDLRSGRRSSRNAYLGPLLSAVTGAEAGFAVNNNAAALIVAIASLAGSGRVAVSRGELIEIGGSFRLPELMAATGTDLVEVGTTNRTRLADFERVVSTVDAILKVHPSNYRIAGFHEDVDHADLAGLAARHGIPFVFDAGSGLIDAATPWIDGPTPLWLQSEPGIRQAVGEGADLVLFSGDKLLGGPQAGVVVGTRIAVEAAARHPLARAMRLDGGRIAGLAATFELYLDQRVMEIPFWAMAAAPVGAIDERARAVTRGIAGVGIVDGESVPGAGSVPGETIPTRLIEVPGGGERTWASLAGEPHRVVGTRRDGSVYLDLRSALPRDDERVRAALLEVVG
jgi:L-seryl-tRNA(Ser) seleniumtransferase